MSQPTNPRSAADTTCVWEEDDEMCGVFDTKCGTSFEFTEGGPEENGMKYCPYCGKTLVAHYSMP
jgi:hypothetical protein